MEQKKMKLSDMRKPEKNVRKHSKAQIDEYMRSVNMFGQIRPIVVDEHGTILCGNGLYEAMTGLGMTTANVYVMEGLTEAQKKKLMMADNRIFNLGSDDMSVFEEFVAELNGDFDVPGYDVDLLKTLSYDEDDVDDALDNYGKITEEDKETLQRAEKRYEEEEEEYVASSERYAPEPNEETVSAGRELERRYIICPKCGEKIWL